MIIWCDMPRVRIRHKCWHIHKIGKTLHRDFTNDCGDIPVAHINEVTNKCEGVVNTRGRAYAARNRQMYRKKYNRARVKRNQFN